MLQANLIYIDPAFRIGERAFAHKVRCTLWWHHMQDVERFFNSLQIALRIFFFEPGFLFRPIDGDQFGIEIQLYAVTIYIFHQRRYEGRHAKQHATCIIEFNLYIFQRALFFPFRAGQVHGLLRCACTFNRHRWLGENCLARFQIAHQ